jgi:hypothetical protein
MNSFSLEDIIKLNLLNSREVKLFITSNLVENSSTQEFRAIARG